MVESPTLYQREKLWGPFSLNVIVFFHLTQLWRRPSNFKMHPRLKNVTERAQKYDFSVNFHILIEQTGFRSDILCQKVDIKRHCVFPLNIALKETFQL